MKQESLKVYDKRYQFVYESGAKYWNEHEPHPKLLEIARGLPPEAKCIDLGCGEGHEARAVAAAGLTVTAIDLSPTVIKRAMESTDTNLKVNYLVGDITDLSTLGIESNTYNLAINIGCLHMMAENEDRVAHLTEVKRILVDGGLFFLQNGLSLEDVNPKTPEEKQTLEQLQEFFKKQPKPGELVSNQISTHDGEKNIMVPLCPNGKRLSMQEYIIELEKVGFSILFTEQSGGANMSFEAIIVAKA